MPSPKSRNATWQVLALVFTWITTLFSMTASAQTSGTIFNYAGIYTQEGYSGDGGPANKALLANPLLVVHDSSGNIFFFDAQNNVIREVNAKTGIIATYAGNGQPTPNSTAALPGDGGPALSAIISPSGLAFDAADNLYLWGAPLCYCIRKIDHQSGIINTVANPAIPFNSFAVPSLAFTVNPAGTSAYAGIGLALIYEISLTTSAATPYAGMLKATVGSGDGGPATSAGINALAAATDQNGNLFILEGANVRKVNTQGIISTAFSSKSLVAQHFALDAAGNFFLATQTQIFKAAQGATSATLVAGDGTANFSKAFVDNSFAVDVPISPTSMTVDSAGNLFLVDTYIIAKVFGVGSSVATSGVATVVSAASSLVEPLAPGSIATAYASDLANGIASSTALPLPTSLSGTSAIILDAAGVTTPTPLFFVSPGQVNFYIPTGVAVGAATVSFTSGDGTQSVGAMTIAAVAPGIFVLNSSALAAANTITVNRDGTTTNGNDFQIVNGAIAPFPINLGPPVQEVYLVLYGTGISGRTSLANVMFNIAGMSLPVAYAGPQGDPGLDQVNVVIPLSLAQSGTTNISLTVDGVKSNTATIDIM